MGSDAYAKLFYGVTFMQEDVGIDTLLRLTGLDEDAESYEIREKLAKVYGLEEVYLPSYDVSPIALAVPGMCLGADWDGPTFIGETLPQSPAVTNPKEVLYEATRNAEKLIRDLDLDPEKYRVGWYLMAAYG